MIPQDVLSTQAITAPLILPDPQPNPLLSREYGGVALNDSSQGLQVKVWSCTVLGTDIVVYADDVNPTIIIPGVDATEVSLAFDQNMRPFIAYVEAGITKFYWFDTSIPGPTTTTLGSDITTPRATLDDHRQTQNASSDIVLVYIRDGNLYFRQQRERYEVEHLLYADINLDIINPQVRCVGMNMIWRLQIEVDGTFYG